VGIHRDPQTLVDTLRAMRRQVDISTEVGVVHDIRLQVGSSRQRQQPAVSAA
jgi:DNA-directed RNA polymerase II subunit RPB2